jgi:hypothetical protein
MLDGVARHAVGAPMPLVACPSCGHSIPFEDALAGRPLRCPGCAAAFTAPTLATASSLGPAREAAPTPSGGPSHAVSTAPASRSAPGPAPPTAQGPNEHLAWQRAVRRVFASVALSVGVGVTAGAVYAFVGGARQVTVQFWMGLLWTGEDVVFGGAALLFVGCGLFVFGLTLLRAPGRARRAAAWGLLAGAVAGGLGGWAAHRVTGKFPIYMTQEAYNRARAVEADYLRLGSRGPVTDEFRRRLEAEGSRTLYFGDSSHTTWLVSRDEMLMSGRVLATEKIVRRVTPAGDQHEDFLVSPPRRVACTIRLKRVGGAWLVDDYTFGE